MLDDTPIPLIRDLQDYVRQSQQQAMPNVPRQLSTIHAEEDAEFSSSLYTLSRGDGSVTTFDEVLKTYYPEKNAKEQLLSPKQLIKDSPLAESSHTISPKSVDHTGKIKRGTRVSLDKLESELNALPHRQERRRSSAGWAAEKITAE
jgi:hypothetical protein